VGLGGGPLGNYLHAISDARAAEVVEAAWESGIRYFDTAPFYGLGLSERRMGRALRERPRSEFILSSKVGRLVRPGPGDDGGFAVPGDHHVEWDFSRDGVLRSVTESLDRLGLDHVDILFIHDPDRHWPQALDEAYPALADLRAQGIVRAIGVGMNQSPMLVDFVKHTDLDLLLAANQVTLLRRTAFEELLPLCQDRGIPVIAASLFHRGLLAAAEPPADAPAEVHAYAAACARHGVPLPAAALQFPLRHPAVSTVLVGAHAPDHVTANLQALDHPLPSALWDELA
jgi:D-threo-aldose 1-dehydrogenase